MESFVFRNVSFSYPDREEKALDNISFSLKKGSFTVICGASGCGKTTLLKHFKSCLAPCGTFSGEILLDAIPLSRTDDRIQAEKTGFVSQSPSLQCVTDKVWHEMAFGLENLGRDSGFIRRRVAEAASFFGIENWFHADVSTLSDGQKQLLSLASAVAMSPELLVLDEPSARLDPIAAHDFFSVLERVNRELGITVVLSEHRLEEVLRLASRVIVMENGRIISDSAPGEAARRLKELGSPMLYAMPAAARIWAGLDTSLPCPLSVRDGREFLRAFAENRPLRPVREAPDTLSGAECVLSAREVSFRYPKGDGDTVKNLNITLKKGELYALLGGNGTGKTTALKLLSGIYRPRTGSLRVRGKTAYLPQLPDALFVKDTVTEDLFDVLSSSSLTPGERENELARAVRLCGLEPLLQRNPRDLSEGEKQRAALAKTLLARPDILLLDEPAKGCDAAFKRNLAAVLHKLSEDGISIVLVSHDIELCAENADRCGLFFDGEITAEGTSREFFAGNIFYTTPAHRIAGELIPDAVTAAQVIGCCGGKENTPRGTEPSRGIEPGRPSDGGKGGKQTVIFQKPRLSAKRKLAAGIGAAAAAAAFFYSAHGTDLTAVTGKNPYIRLGAPQAAAAAVLIAALLITVFALNTEHSKKPEPLKTGHKKQNRRAAAAACMAAAAVPATLAASFAFLPKESFGIVSLAVLLEAMLPFFIVFEGRHPPAKELAVISVLCAAGIAGRAAFFMLPQFKPVTAVTIIAGAAFGAEAGFLTGSLTMLVSNMLFSQGPWTPWQMFALGIIGSAAGLLTQRGLLPRSRTALALFGAVSALAVYGGIMNLAGLLMFSPESLGVKSFLAFCAAGLPMDMIHAAATFIFLFAAGDPSLRALERVKLKYGLFR